MNDALLKRHLELVIEANKVTNITRISTWDEGMLLHVEDSLVGLPEVVAAPEGRYVDLGSGAGYPGIPWLLRAVVARCWWIQLGRRRLFWIPWYKSWV